MVEVFVCKDCGKAKSLGTIHLITGLCDECHYKSLFETGKE